MTLDTKVAQMKEAGLVGMEVHYTMYSEETVERLLAVAKRHDLIHCGGSDYHALGNAGEVEPGLPGPPIGFGGAVVSGLTQAGQESVAPILIPAHVS